MMNIINTAFDAPVTWSLMIILTLIYLSSPEKYIDCTNNNFKQHLVHSFIHTSPGHLLTNLYSLYSLSYLERSYGSFRYALISVFSLLFSTWIQTLLSKQLWWPFTTCSVGFSAVILGVVIFDRLSANNWIVDFAQLQNMLVLLILPFIRNPRTSLTGHFSGILAGVIMGIISGMLAQ